MKKKILKCESLDFLPKSVKSLEIPFCLIKYLSHEKLPLLKNLRIFTFLDNLNCHADELALDNDLNIHTIHFYRKSLKSKLHWTDCGINLSNYKNLSYVSSLIDKEGRVINQLSMLQKLTSLSLTNINDTNTLKHLEHLGLKYLMLNTIKPSTDFTGLSKFTDLEVLRISYYKAEFDCALLTDLPYLKEVDFTTVKKILNPEALLDMKNLEIVSFIDCASYLKRKEKTSLKNHHFKHLMID